jgi:hypothetical protein
LTFSANKSGEQYLITVRDPIKDLRCFEDNIRGLSFLAHLRHTNVVTYFGCCVLQEEIYIFMDFPGIRVTQLVKLKLINVEDDSIRTF